MRAVREEFPRGPGSSKRDPGHRAKVGTTTPSGLISPADLHLPAAAWSPSASPNVTATTS